MSANNLNIGIAGSAVNPLCDIFHMPDRVVVSRKWWKFEEAA
jgi:hypothetical protein